jgi:hypothetical protein
MMSEKKAQAIIEGRFHPYGTRNKKGTYVSKSGRTYFFKSSWEEAVMKWLDASEIVLCWDYEPVRIPYTYDNHKRWYVPDFIISFWGGEAEMWEVKPKEFHLTERVARTTDAGKKYCAENDIVAYVLVDKEGLVQRGII